MIYTYLIHYSNEYRRQIVNRHAQEEPIAMDPWAHHELAGASVVDQRHISALVRLAECRTREAEASYSEACGSAVRQAARRACRNQGTSVDGILQGHYQQTAARCAQYPLVLIAQDTMVADYSTHRATRGLGPVNTRPDSLGLLVHSAMAMTPQRLPLGLLHLDIWARDPDTFGTSAERADRPIEEKESHKWIRGLRAVADRLPAQQEAVLIQDREADVAEFLATPRRARLHLLVRASQPRNVTLLDTDYGGPCNLMEAAASAPVVAEMRVEIPRKPGHPKRQATLIVRARRVNIHPPMRRRTSKMPRTLTLWLVDACELNAPKGEDPIRWVLLTSMPINNGDDACRTVEFYACRWGIEQLHKVLKSGCRAERLQIDDAHPLKNVLAVYYIVAWRLLWLTHLARTDPLTPASVVLTDGEIQVLEAATRRNVTTVSEAVTALAILGGQEYYKKAPPPGPKRLWQGIRRLQAMTEGWQLAMQRLLYQDVNQD